MSDLWDAVNWENLQGRTGAKAGYLDGAESQWPPEGWQAFEHDDLVHITVLAAAGADAYDGETGNAGPEAVAAALSGEVGAGRHPWLYSNQDQLPAYLAALKSKGINPSDRSVWPRPGVYLWLADPSGNLENGSWRPPVDPVAVQDAFDGTVDHSTVYVSLGASAPPTPAPAPAPQPPTQQEVTVLVPQLEEGVEGPAVKAAQTLLGGIATDGVFGPVTKSRVEQFQHEHGLSVDGVVGVHTWGQLLGHPQ